MTVDLDSIKRHWKQLLDGYEDPDEWMTEAADFLDQDAVELIVYTQKLRDLVGSIYTIAHSNVDGSNYTPGFSEIIDLINRHE